jgi:uncharacterized membrane protein YhaH (DUF805 family)
MTDDDVRLQRGGVRTDRPYYRVPVGEAIRRFWVKYATFTGRASRSEFWWWWLTWFAVGLVVQLVGDISTGSSIGESVLGGTLFTGWIVITAVGMFALGARRLHDANLTGWLQAVVVIPFLGWIAILVLACLPTKPNGARFDARGTLHAGGPRGQD